MEIDRNNQTMILKDVKGDVTSFLMKVTHEYKTFKDHNIIMDLLDHNELTMDDIKSFLYLSKKHKKAKKSFIIVAAGIDYNDTPKKLTVVPTLVEANDIIDMEDIERDLGI